MIRHRLVLIAGLAALFALAVSAYLLVMLGIDARLISLMSDKLNKLVVALRQTEVYRTLSAKLTRYEMGDFFWVAVSWVLKSGKLGDEPTYTKGPHDHSPA
ncbi:MAG: hypothetical protein ABR556_12660 [Pyrinomonadaceae bacterium]